jgi:hypothetical protein
VHAKAVACLLLPYAEEKWNLALGLGFVGSGEKKPCLMATSKRFEEARKFAESDKSTSPITN